MFHPQTFAWPRIKAAALPLAWCAAFGLASFTSPVDAQTPTAASAASATDAAMERSRRQADNVYRWIRLHAENPRKPEAVKLRPKTEPAAPTARRPEAPAAGALANASSPEVAATEAAPGSATSLEAATPMQADAARATDARPAVAAAAATEAASALPPVEEAQESLQLVEQVQPDFPRELRSSVRQGKVMLAFTVQPNGSVTDASVLSASNRKLGRPALEAVGKWRFEPIRTARGAQVEIEFNME